MTVALDAAGLEVGDTAGLALLSTPYAWIGVVKSAEATTLQMCTGRAGRGGGAAGQTNGRTICPVNPPRRVWLRVHCNFDTDEACFSWSAEGKEFTPLGNPFT